MPYQSSVSFDSVIVVESLRKADQFQKGDLRTGTDLFETTIAPACLAHNIYGELYHVSSRRELFGAFSRILALANDGRSPIVHLEMHGDEAGLQLANYETVAWPDLAPPFTDINRRTRMNLLVVAAACQGWHLSEILRPVDRAPAWGIVGPPATTEAGDLYAAMKGFYGSLLADLDLTKAMRALNSDMDITEWRFRIQTADLLYCRVFEHYMHSLVEEESQAERTNRLVADIAMSQKLDVTQTMTLRAEIAAELADDQFWFDRYKSRFLMLDLFPENARRFQLELKDCLPKAV